MLIVYFDIMRQSNFDQAMGEFLLELAIGTAVMLIQPGDEVTLFAILRYQHS